MYSYSVPPKSFVMLYFPSENAPAPPNPCMMEQDAQFTQDFTFTPSIGQCRFSSAWPASTTRTLKSGASFISSYAE